jgi:hypothetical protein
MIKDAIIHKMLTASVSNPAKSGAEVIRIPGSLAFRLAPTFMGKLSLLTTVFPTPDVLRLDRNKIENIHASLRLCDPLFTYRASR